MSQQRHICDWFGCIGRVKETYQECGCLRKSNPASEFYDGHESTESALEAINIFVRALGNKELDRVMKYSSSIHQTHSPTAGMEALNVFVHSLGNQDLDRVVRYRIPQGVLRQVNDEEAAGEFLPEERRSCVGCQELDASQERDPPDDRASPPTVPPICLHELPAMEPIRLELPPHAWKQKVRTSSSTVPLMGPTHSWK